ILLIPLVFAQFSTYEEFLQTAKEQCVEIKEGVFPKDFEKYCTEVINGADPIDNCEEYGKKSIDLHAFCSSKTFILAKKLKDKEPDLQYSEDEHLVPHTEFGDNPGQCWIKGIDEAQDQEILECCGSIWPAACWIKCLDEEPITEMRIDSNRKPYIVDTARESFDRNCVGTDYDERNPERVPYQPPKPHIEYGDNAGKCWDAAFSRAIEQKGEYSEKIDICCGNIWSKSCWVNCLEDFPLIKMIVDETRGPPRNDPQYNDFEEYCIRKAKHKEDCSERKCTEPLVCDRRTQRCEKIALQGEKPKDREFCQDAFFKNNCASPQDIVDYFKKMAQRHAIKYIEAYEKYLETYYQEILHPFEWEEIPLSQNCEFFIKPVAFEVVQTNYADDLTFPKLRLFKPTKKNEYNQLLNLEAKDHSVIVGVPDHNKIVVFYKTDCTVNEDISPIFIWEQWGKSDIIYKSHTVSLPTKGPRGKFIQNYFFINTKLGIPKDKAFFPEFGPYKAKLALDGKEKIAIISTLNGSVVFIKPLVVGMVPFTFNKNPSEIKEIVEELSDITNKLAGDFLPMASNKMVTVPFPVYREEFIRSKYMGLSYPPSLELYRRRIDDKIENLKKEESQLTHKWILKYRKKAINEFRKYFSVMARDTYVNRIAVIIDENECRKYVSNDSVGLSLNNKVNLIRSDANMRTVLHELIHTFDTNSMFSDDEMEENCGTNFHNKKKTHNANGMRLTLRGEENRMIFEKDKPIMAYGVHISLCSAYQTINYLSTSLVDPEVILVSGDVSKNGTGSIDLVSQINNTVDLEEGEGEWELRTLNEKGETLKKFSLVPLWEIILDRIIEGENTIELETAGFVRTIPNDDLVKGIALANKGKIIDKLMYNTKPSLEITKQELRGSTLTLEWKGNDIDNDPLLYSVLHKPLNQTWYYPQEYLTTNTKTTIPLTEPTEIKIKVQDGTQSTEDIFIIE
ncbi:hypothetical protein ACFLZN_00360, partial [Nanoarchaeota archaeon]